MVEATEDNNPNSIASSLLSLVELITSAEQGGAQTASTQQEQVSHTAGASHSQHTARTGQSKHVLVTASTQQVQVSHTAFASHSQHTTSTDQSHSTY